MRPGRDGLHGAGVEQPDPVPGAEELALDAVDRAGLPGHARPVLVVRRRADDRDRARGHAEVLRLEARGHAGAPAELVRVPLEPDGAADPVARPSAAGVHAGQGQRRARRPAGVDDQQLVLVREVVAEDPVQGARLAGDAGAVLFIMSLAVVLVVL